MIRHGRGPARLLPAALRGRFLNPEVRIRVGRLHGRLRLNLSSKR
jgi:hypothetical protein